MNYKETKGITLISLIITIIILIILVAISIRTITASRIINVATDGAGNYARAGLEEEEEFNKATNKIESITAEKPIYTEQDIEAMIGKYVDYHPEKGTFKFTEVDTKTGKTYGELTGTDKNTDDFATEEEFGWRIWSIEGKKMTLIADRVTTKGGVNNGGSLALEGDSGKENGIDILNEICRTCYSNGNWAKGKSLSLDMVPEDYRGYYTQVPSLIYHNMGMDWIGHETSWMASKQETSSLEVIDICPSFESFEHGPAFGVYDTWTDGDNKQFECSMFRT